MLLTPITNASFVGNLIQQPKVFTQSFLRTINIDGKKIDLQGFGKVTEYANGTTQIELSVTAENISTILPRIRINLTKTIQATEFSGNPSSSATQTQSISGGYTGPLQEYIWDGFYFVLAPGNTTTWIKYDHNNNYWRYYPLEWNRWWEMKGVQKIHTHMAISDVNAWIQGTMSDEEIHRKIVGGEALAMSIIGPTLGAILGYYIGGIYGLIVSLIVSALATLFAWLLQLLGISNKSQWIKDVVQYEQGGGFHWAWGFKTTYFGAVLLGGLPFEQSPLSEGMRRYSATFLTRTVREFSRSWGMERDNPETCSVEFWNIVNFKVCM
jgi:hypothetical protein